MVLTYDNQTRFGEALLPTENRHQMDDERFDGLYLNVAQTTRGIEPLLDTVFSFLRRKTDFFQGPNGAGADAAIATVNEVLRKHAKLYEACQTKKTPKKKKKQEEVIEMGTDGSFDASSKTSIPLEAPMVVPGKSKPKIEQNSKDSVETTSTNDTKGPPPIGNGGTVPDKYVWTQTLAELSLTIPVPDGTRGRNLDVAIAKKHLQVKLRTPPNTLVVDAPLTKPIICDDSFWTVEDGNKLVIHLQKLNQMEWWECVCEGDPKIKLTDIQPENSNLGDLDGETRQTVEKMMFDQRQKAMGLPTSDEQKKFEMFEKFKAQHPEMDFSNAKIS